MLWVAIPPVPNVVSSVPFEFSRARPVSEVTEVAVGRTEPASRTLPLDSSARSWAIESLPAKVARAMPPVPKVDSRPADLTFATVNT